MIAAKIVMEPFEAQIGNDFKVIAKTITDNDGNSLNLDTSFFEIEWKDTGGIAYLVRHDPDGENLNCKVENGILQMIFDRTNYRFRYPDFLSYRIHTRAYDPDMLGNAFDVWTPPQKSNIRLTVGSSLFGCKKILCNMEMPFNYQKGDKGDKGDEGEKGAIGERGDQGERGEKGEQGMQGEKGIEGEKGVQGEKGSTGMSAYQFAVNGGYKGTEEQFAQEQVAIINNSARLASLENNKQDKPIAGRTFFTPLFVARGAVFNDKTGYYELNGLTDITESQMMAIYNYTNCGLKSQLLNDTFTRLPIRTNYPIAGLYVGAYTGIGVEARGTFSGNYEVEIINLAPLISLSTAQYMFYNCVKLKSITGELNVSKCTSINDMFTLCNLLERVKINKLNLNISFVSSPNLNREDILYFIVNSVNTTPITANLHTTAKTRLTNEDIALAVSKNITIA